MHVVEDDAHRVVADRLKRANADGALARDDLLLARIVPLNLCRRALDPQQLRRKTELLTGVEVDFQSPFGGLVANFGRPMLCIERVGQVALHLPLGILVQGPRLVDQHDRDAVANGIGQPGLITDQFLLFRVVAQGRLGQRTDQDLQQFGIDAGGNAVFQSCRSLCGKPIPAVHTNGRVQNGPISGAIRRHRPDHMRQFPAGLRRCRRGFEPYRPPEGPAFRSARTGRSSPAR